MMTCKICGISIDNNKYKRKYYPECAKSVNRVDAEKSHERLEFEKAMKKYHSESLEKDAVEASKMNLSYGQYMALKRSGKIICRQK